MVQSVALKRPQGGVRGWLFHVPLPGLGSCSRNPVSHVSCGRRAPQYCLHCLGVSRVRLPVLPERPHCLPWAIQGQPDRLTSPGGAPRGRGRASADRGCVLLFPTSAHPGLAQHPNRALGPKPFGTSQDQFAAS